MGAKAEEKIRLGVPIKRATLVAQAEVARAQLEAQRLTAHRDLVTLCANIHRAVRAANPESRGEVKYVYDLGVTDDGYGMVWELDLGDETFFLPSIKIVRFKRGDSAGELDALATANGELFVDSGGILDRRMSVVSFGSRECELWPEATQDENIAHAVDSLGNQAPNTVWVDAAGAHEVKVAGKVKQLSIRRIALRPGTPIDLYRGIYLSIQRQLHQEKSSS